MPRWGKVFLFGDSQTEFCFTQNGCWGTLLADALRRKCDLINRGFAGYNSRFCKMILPDLLTPEDAKDVVAVTIFLGSNDMGSLVGSPDTHVPVEEYGENLQDMVQHCLSVGLRPDQVILITPAALDQGEWDKACVLYDMAHCKGARTDKSATLYASVCRGVARDMGTQCIDLFNEMKKSKDYQSYLHDGLHFSPTGSQLLFSLVKPIVLQLAPDEDMYPFYKEIDNTDSESTKTSLSKT